MSIDRFTIDVTDTVGASDRYTLTIPTASILLVSGVGGGGGGGHTISDETTPLAQRAGLRFQGQGVTAADNAGAAATDVTIPGLDAYEAAGAVATEAAARAAADAAHVAASDPHPGYLTPAEGAAAYDALGAASAGDAAHVAAGDPHPQYLTPAEGNAAYDPTGAASAAVAAHEADTTNVHGIANTALLETTSGAQAKADAKVGDAIVDGVTTVAPSQNAVFDALAGKAAASHSHAESDVIGLVSDLAGKQPLAALLTALSALTPTNGQVVKGNGSTFVMGPAPDSPTAKILKRQYFT